MLGPRRWPEVGNGRKGAGGMCTACSGGAAQVQSIFQLHLAHSCPHSTSHGAKPHLLPPSIVSTVLPGGCIQEPTWEAARSWISTHWGRSLPAACYPVHVPMPAITAPHYLLPAVVWQGQKDHGEEPLEVGRTEQYPGSCTRSSPVRKWCTPATAVRGHKHGEDSDPCSAPQAQPQAGSKSVGRPHLVCGPHFVHPCFRCIHG